MTDDDGLHGFGQSVPVETWTYETVESVETTLRHYIAPAIIGEWNAVETRTRRKGTLSSASSASNTAMLATEPETTVCIVEAMKLMNEIESDVAGEIVTKLITNGQPIEYGQDLFSIRPRK